MGAFISGSSKKLKLFQQLGNTGPQTVPWESHVKLDDKLRVVNLPSRDRMRHEIAKFEKSNLLQPNLTFREDIARELTPDADRASKMSNFMCRGNQPSNKYISFK